MYHLWGKILIGIFAGMTGYDDNVAPFVVTGPSGIIA